MKPKILSPRQGLIFFAGAGIASCGLTGFISQAAAQAPVAPPEPSADGIAFFETKIRPVLAKECFSCHGPKMQMAGLRLDSRVGFAKGGEKGALVVPGDPEKSLLVHAVRYSGPLKMPPSGKLKPNELTDLEAWVRMGAPWPKGGAVKSTGRGPLWSLLPVKKPPVPRPKIAGWAKDPLDSFVLAKIEAKGARPAPAADRRTLLRRVSYDLVGLPPNASEVAAFVADKAPNAYEKVVDRLLASPRYGERWARQWLDVARYADTKGYVFEEDRNYYNAYTYRQWVIDALNRDLPYDRFVMQQIAADRLPETQGEDKTPLAAMGFLTLGRRFLNSTPDIIDDRIDVTMRGFQGFTVACARCHDHKFDPIPTKDYYSLYGVFDSSEERSVPISPRAVREPWERFNARVAEAEVQIRDLTVAQVSRLRGMETTGDVKATLQSLRPETVATGGVLDRLLPAFEPTARDRLKTLQDDLAEIRKSPPATPEFAMAMGDRKDAHDGVIFRRGNPGNRGDVAPRRFLEALSQKADREHWTEGSGRLELAKAIASRDNPLTARVFVNRVWLGHFGSGLVRTPSDFGWQGEKPTHRELLDYLASTFMESGWSVKKLHRRIVLSATYRQSSNVSQATFEADPENRLLNRMNRHRLDLEQMRDSLMAASGRLDVRSVGGKSVDLWSRPFTPRRAVYGFVERQNLPGIFRTFDFASPDSTSARRFQTTVPQQALFFLNSPFSIEEAETLAARKEVAGATDNGQRVRRLYQLLFARLPDPDEASAGAAYLASATVKGRVALWQYGFGGFDGTRVAFNPLGHFGEGRYQVGAVFPDPTLGYITLSAGGGHPGRDGSHATIRRWIASADTTLAVSGLLKHGQTDGDGVRARIVVGSSRQVGEWQAHHGEAKTEVVNLKVMKGQTVDFIVDPIRDDNSDSYAWNFTLQSGDGKVWSAERDFSSPPAPPLSKVALYAQALMMTNEFMFVD